MFDAGQIAGLERYANFYQILAKKAQEHAKTDAKQQLDQKSKAARTTIATAETSATRVVRA